MDPFLSAAIDGMNTSASGSQSRDENVPVPTNMQKFHWKPHQDRTLLDILKYNIRIGRISRTCFKKTVYNMVVHELLVEQGINISIGNVANRMKMRRRTYSLYCKLLATSGMGWNSIENRFEAPDYAWDGFVGNNKGLRRFKKRQQLSYDDLHEVFRGESVNGAFAMGPDVGDYIDSDAGGDNDEHTPISSHGEDVHTPIGSHGEEPNIGLSSADTQHTKSATHGTPVMGERRQRRRTMRGRPQTPVQQLVTKVSDMLTNLQPLVCKNEWFEKHTSAMGVLTSLGLPRVELMRAIKYFDKHPHAINNLLCLPQDALLEYVQCCIQDM